MTDVPSGVVVHIGKKENTLLVKDAASFKYFCVLVPEGLDVGMHDSVELIAAQTGVKAVDHVVTCIAEESCTSDDLDQWKELLKQPSFRATPSFAAFSKSQLPCRAQLMVGPGQGKFV